MYATRCAIRCWMFRRPIKRIGQRGFSLVAPVTFSQKCEWLERCVPCKEVHRNSDAVNGKHVMMVWPRYVWPSLVWYWKLQLHVDVCMPRSRIQAFVKFQMPNMQCSKVLSVWMPWGLSHNCAQLAPSLSECSRFPRALYAPGQSRLFLSPTGF